MILMSLYVDDLILARSRNDIFQDTNQALSDRFEMTDMDQLKHFLEMDIDHSYGKWKDADLRNLVC